MLCNNGKNHAIYLEQYVLNVFCIYIIKTLNPKVKVCLTMA